MAAICQKWHFMKNLLITSSLCLAAAAPVLAGSISLSGPLSDDASTQISTSNVYTHAISGGSAATVNGVAFSPLTTAATPANFSWTSPTKAIIESNLGDWVPATGGVTGTGLISLLSGFTYAPSGADPGSSQTFTVSGLSIGTTYDTRLYIRTWDTEASGRPIDFTMTNGTEIDPFSGPQDRPGTVLGTGNQHQAFYVNYRFTAQGTDLVINTTVSASGGVGSGSYHMYALTNQVIPEPATALCLALAGFVGITRRRR